MEKISIVNSKDEVVRKKTIDYLQKIDFEEGFKISLDNSDIKLMIEGINNENSHGRKDKRINK